MVLIKRRLTRRLSPLSIPRPPPVPHDTTFSPKSKLELRSAIRECTRREIVSRLKPYSRGTCHISAAIDTSQSSPVIDTRVITTKGDLEDALKLREQVFVEEYKVEIEEEIDEYDVLGEKALHVLSRLGDVPLGTGRLIYPADRWGSASISRVAVEINARGLGVGRSVMHKLHDEARARKIKSITIGAKLDAIPFYEKLGYTTYTDKFYGNTFLDANMKHKMMECRFYYS